MTSYQAMLVDRIANLENDPAWPYVRSKLAGRDLAARAGVATPALIACADEPGDLEPPTRPAVLKPDFGQSSVGLSLLIPTGQPHTYTDPSRGRTVTWEQALARASAAYHHPKAPVRGPWLLEELVLAGDGKQTTDYKLYTFGGRVEVILQVRLSRREGAYLWRGPDWAPLPDIQPKRGKAYDPNLPLPADPEAMTSAAHRVATTIGSPFIRVDLYDHPQRGTVFGETCLTPIGGKIPFAPEWDNHLGTAWAAAV